MNRRLSDHKTTTARSGTIAQRSKAAIERMGSALLAARKSDVSGIDLDRLGFELRVVLQRVLILDRVGMLDDLLAGQNDFGWSAVLDLDLESELFHVEHNRQDCAHGNGDRVWSSDWMDLVRREFVACGGKWFGEVVDLVRGDAADFGAVDESLMAWTASVGYDGGFELVGEDGSARKLGGVFYTPDSVVKFVLDRALTPAIEACGDDVDRLLGLRVCDPACGCGYFLIAAARRIQDRLIELGRTDRFGEIVARCVVGGDINPLTAELCRWSLWLEARDRSVSIEHLRANVVAGDSLEESVFDFDSCDVVVGNPPFLNQLGSGTARSGERVRKLRERGLIGSATYTDEASAFFVLGLQIAKDGGRVCMVQPQSVMATRGGAWMRERVAALGSLESVWVSNAHVFGDASVYTCGPCVRIGGIEQGARSIRRWSGAGFEAHEEMVVSSEEFASLETWSSVAAVTMGIPEIEIQPSGIVGDVAHATADFRDEYYGLAGKLVEDSECADGDGSVRVVTTGLVDLGACHWGTKSTRILKQKWESPRVSGEAILGDARLAKWVAARSVEKVLVATQTKVVEAFVDAGDQFVAVTPMITVVVRGDEDTACRGRSSRGTLGGNGGVDVWKLGAAIGSPVCTMFAMRHFGGAAMHADALKMSARQVMALPLPIDIPAWETGASAFKLLHETDGHGYQRAVAAFGEVMCAAYGVDEDDRDELMGWWLGRLGISAQFASNIG